MSWPERIFTRRVMSAADIQSEFPRVLDQVRSSCSAVIAWLPGIRTRARKPGRDSSSPSQSDCIFCLHHHPEQNKVMIQNDTFFARYDNFPAANGHVEIVPKRHVVSFFDLRPDEVR